NVDGSLDAGFDGGAGANGAVFALGLQSQGKVVIAGSFTSVNNTNRNRLARLNSNGSLDLGFNPGPGANGIVYTLVVLPNDDLFIGGDFSMVDGNPRNGVAKIIAHDLSLHLLGIAISPGNPAQISLTSESGRTN